MAKKNNKALKVLAKEFKKNNYAETVTWFELSKALDKAIKEIEDDISEAEAD